MKKVFISLIVILSLVGSIAFASSSLFTDVPDDAWYKKAVELVAAKGIMQGSEGKFYPDEYVTRAQMAQIITKLLDVSDSAPDKPGSEDQVISTVASVMTRCVSIFAGAGWGSGVAIGQNYILTADHVCTVDDALIAFSNRDTVPGRVKYRLPEKDLAIVEMNSPDFIFEPIELAENVTLAETIVVIGTPLGNDFTVTKGIVSNVNRLITDKICIQFDAPVNSGNSGGGLFNLKGELLGIVALKSKEGEGLGYAVPYDTVREFIGKLKLQ